MRWSHCLLAASLAWLAAAPARADFRLQTNAAASLAAEPPTAAPVHGGPEPSRFKRADGFGREVPLRFAIRQIVPPGVDATIAAGIDPDAPVDWTGGRPWNRVLAAAIQPLGLRLLTGVATARITR